MLYDNTGDNLNSGFYKDIDTNFEEACIMSEKDFSHKELIEMLKNGNIPQKQIAALMLDCINSQEDAKILVSNLTGCDGKIREAVALKINQLVKQGFCEYFYSYPQIFADATIDINGNICRLIVDSLTNFQTDSDFYNAYLNRIFDYIQEAFNSLDKIIYKDKKYTINKQLFKLYWCLEALKAYTRKIPHEKLFPILERTSSEREYTIREKTAQIVALIDDDKFSEIKNKLKNDENYYVRAALKQN